MTPAKRVTKPAKARAEPKAAPASKPRASRKKAAPKAASKGPPKRVSRKKSSPAEVAQQPPSSDWTPVVTQTPAADDAYERKRSRSAEVSRQTSKAGRELPPINTRGINWERRLACMNDLERSGRTYMPNVFSLPPSRDHKRVIDKLQRACYEGGSSSLAMPRAGGKSAWCRAGMNWSTSNAHRAYPYLIGANDEAARKTLKAIRTISLGSELLLQDFPELYAPIRALGQDSAHKARGQLYHGRSTWLEWGTEKIRFPVLLLTDEEAKPYHDNLPDFLVRHEEWWIPRNGAAVLEAHGITGGIRGGNDMHPLLLELRRPDLILLDDVQNDEGAKSPATCEKLIELIEGTCAGLAGPGELPAMLMPCTVIFEGDVADTFLDRSKKPEWQGERCSMVVSWPPGIDDYEISDETTAGKHWLRYFELLKQSFNEFGDRRLATAYYAEHREAMDEDFVVSWPERYNSKKKFGENRELSGQQHAMNLRAKSPSTFPAEYQNRPKKKLTVVMPVKVDDLIERIVAIDPGECPAHTHAIVTFVDVQDELLFYLTLAVAQDFTGVIVDFGTWPELTVPYFTKAQSETWCLLSNALFEAHPEAKAQAKRNASGRIKAPFEAKIYHAVKMCCNHLLAKDYHRAEVGGTLRNTKIGVDVRWGQASDALKRAIADMRRNEIVPCMGQYVSPQNKQYEEYQRTTGWLFEDQVHPGLQEAKWVWRPGPDGRYYLSIDANRVKTFLMARLSCPPGSLGAIQYHRAPPDQLRLCAEHIANSEYPEEVTARGRTKKIWQSRDGRPDNEYLDCAAGCMALASMCGARLQENLAADGSVRPRRPSLKDRWRSKHGG